MREMSESDGIFVQRTLDVKPIAMYKRGELRACQDRLVKVILPNNEELYCDWHAFTKMRNEFRKKFGLPKPDMRDMPGVTDAYDGQVRTKFDLNELPYTTSPAQFCWIFRRLPDSVPMPRRQGHTIFIHSID